MDNPGSDLKENERISRMIDFVTELPPAIAHQILLNLDITSLFSAADCCQAWRKMITDEAFLDKVCQDRFDIPKVDQLPELLPSEKLLINTQRLMYQGLREKFMDADENLMKIYALQMRAVWLPLSFDKSSVGGDFKQMKLEYPWPYDIRSKIRIFPDIQRFSARFHAAFPQVFVETMYEESSRIWAWDFKSISYYTDVKKSHLHRLWIDHHFPLHQLALADRKPKVIEFQPGEEVALYIVIYDDDRTWRLVCCGLTLERRLLTRDPVSSPPLSWRASLDEIRQGMGPVIDDYYHHAGRMRPSDIGISSSYLSESVGIYHNFQKVAMDWLNEKVESAGGHLLEKLHLESDRQKERVKKISDGYCAEICTVTSHEMEGTCGDGQPSSENVLQAIKKALNRSINAAFLPDVKAMFPDYFVYQILQIWSWSKEDDASAEDDENNELGMMRAMMEGKRIFPSNQPRMKIMIRTACNNRGQRQLWPAVVSKKAIDALPKMVSDLEAYILKGLELD